MNKKAGVGEVLWDNAIYLILAVLFFMGMFWFVQSQREGAGIWEDFYAKEMVKVINMAEPGDEVTINIDKAVQIANKWKLNSYSRIFDFDNLKNQVCIMLNNGNKKTCYRYFNDVDIGELDLRIGRGKAAESELYFKVFVKSKIKNVELGEENG